MKKALVALGLLVIGMLFFFTIISTVANREMTYVSGRISFHESYLWLYTITPFDKTNIESSEVFTLSDVETKETGYPNYDGELFSIELTNLPGESYTLSNKGFVVITGDFSVVRSINKLSGFLTVFAGIIMLVITIGLIIEVLKDKEFE